MILTESFIRQSAREARSKGVFFSESTKRFDAEQEYDLFISHSFSDSEIVIGLYQLFQKAGYNVYIDWIVDNDLDRQKVNTDTAALIKKRIKASRGTAYISTTNSTSSRWCPWELGVADGMKGRVCILPIMSSSFEGQEYLGLYPYLQYAQIQGEEKFDFWVWDQKDRSKYIILSAWLSGREPCHH